MRIVEADIEERGWYDARRNEVVIRCGMTFAERRSTLAHELVHVEAGDRYHEGWWRAVHEPAVEARADEVASRRLITMDALMDALVAARDEEQAAAMLNVDVDMLNARLRSMTEGERWHVEQVTRPRRLA